MRPKLRFLDQELLDQIIAEAVHILCTLGVDVHNDEVLSLLADSGAEVDMQAHHVIFQERHIQQALSTVPKDFKLYDVRGRETHHFIDDKVHFTPGSAAVNYLDYDTQTARQPTTADYVDYVKVTSRLKYIAAQSTAFVPADVHEQIADSYRLFLNLLYGEKPVVTGAFTVDSFTVMKNLQLAVRGSDNELRDKPLTIFSCCPTSPLKWSDVTSQNVIDCARSNIPIELIAMPLSGFIAPVTLTGTLIQHTAESLSGIVLSQIANPGAPVLYGGSPAIFDVRYEMPPMGAVESMMIACGYAEIGKHLGLPTQAYTALSDAKLLDAQAGLETSMGATMAALTGINSISGPGLFDYENCFCMEKLIVDHEICGMTKRMIDGIEPKEDFPSIPIMQELLKERHLLIADHSRKYLRDEHYFPGPTLTRANRERWLNEGASTIGERAHAEALRHLEEYKPSHLPDGNKQELIDVMTAEAKRFGQDDLPDRQD
jgi:trimethylamine---corrinoid protein Co-methyltransferase